MTIGRLTTLQSGFTPGYADRPSPLICAALASLMPWSASQGTKEDYAHTFIVKGIDGPALMKVTDEQLQEWKVKVRHRHATPHARVGQAAPCHSAWQRTDP